MTVSSWLDERREALEIEVSLLPWSENREWFFDEGVLRHVSGGFFSVCGIELEAMGLPLHGQQFPMIDQPEIGLLAFLVYRGETGPRWLLQAKAEPGTTGYVQVGPTVQATRSNYQQLHGGAATAYLDEVSGTDIELLTNVYQSEQGSRFLNKFNNNVVRLLDSPVPPVSPEWRWFDAAELRQALAESFTVNTDARSVIVSTCWSLLCEDGRPFAEARTDRVGIGQLSANECGSFRARLRHSLESGEIDISTVIRKLTDPYIDSETRIHRRSLNALSGWRVTRDGIVPDNADIGFDIRSYKVEISGRECESWQQPLLRGLVPQRSVLFVGECDACLKVFLREAREPGFGNSVQFGPSWQSDGLNPNWTNDYVTEDCTIPLLAVTQSDEGGRFMQSIMCYEVREVSASVATNCDEGGAWLSMAQVRELCSASGILTNEARSAISLLLAFA